MANIVDPSSLLPVELFEMVLLHLPLLDLVIVQRVCRAWKATIDASIKAQRALLLKPYSTLLVEAASDNGKWQFQSEEGHAIQHPPLLNPFMKDMVSCSPTARHIGGMYTHSAALCNTVLGSPLEDWEKALWEDRTDHSAATDFDDLKCSLYRMLPTQPPARYLVSECPNRVNEPDDPNFFDGDWEEGDESDEDEDDDLSEFDINPHAHSDGFVRVGDLVNECWEHFITCRKNCNCCEEVEEWT